MKQTKLWMLAAILTISGTGLQAQTKRSDDFRAKYELKEVVVMSRHNIRSPLSSGAASSWHRTAPPRPRADSCRATSLHRPPTCGKTAPSPSLTRRHVATTDCLVTSIETMCAASPVDRPHCPMISVSVCCGGSSPPPPSVHTVRGNHPSVSSVPADQCRRLRG